MNFASLLSLLKADNIGQPSQHFPMKGTICQAIDHWRRTAYGPLMNPTEQTRQRVWWQQRGIRMDCVGHRWRDHGRSPEPPWRTLWPQVSPSLTKSHQVSLSGQCVSSNFYPDHSHVPQPICPKSKICPLSLCVLAIGSVQSPFEVRIRFPLWPSPGFTWGKGSVQWDQIEYILLCQIPSHIQSMRKRSVVGWEFIGQGTKDGCDWSCGQTVKLTDWFTKSALTSSQSPTSSSCGALLVRIGFVRQVTPCYAP